MDLKQFDSKCVRIIDCRGDVFDGFCAWNSPEYDLDSWGREEECLQIGAFLFYPDDIRSVEILEDVGGPYGPFRDAFGTLEELIVADGDVFIDDALESEETLHVLRLLNCLEAHRHDAFPGRDRIPELLRTLLRYRTEPAVCEKARQLLDAWE